jgi:hypothetical protein
LLYNLAYNADQNLLKLPISNIASPIFSNEDAFSSPISFIIHLISSIIVSYVLSVNLFKQHLILSINASIPSVFFSKVVFLKFLMVSQSAAEIFSFLGIFLL